MRSLLSNCTLLAALLAPTLLQAEEPRFTRHVVPLFSRLGCNAGTCRGKVKGENGFRLSLFGFEAVNRIARMKSPPLLATALPLAMSVSTSAQVNFQRDVAPILVKRCLACLGEQKFKGEFQLHTFEALLKPGESDEAPIVAGKPEESYLLTLLTADDADLRMPKDAPRLADAEINLVRQWIAEGAKLDGADNRIRYWLADDPDWENAEKMDKKKRHQIGESGGLNAPIQRLVFGGGQVFAGAAGQSVRQFNAENRNQTRTFSGHEDWVIAIDYHDATKRLATASLSGEVRIWKTDAKDEKELTQLKFVAAPGYQSKETAVTAPSGE